MDKSEIINLFRSRGLRLSEQRLLIYGYLLDNRVHPGAEQIYRELQEEHPALSLTTVYNTLHYLEEHGLVTPLTIEDGEVRYDVNTCFHGHFKCRNCGMVMDVPLEQAPLMHPQVPKGYQIESLHVDFYGCCAACSGDE